MNFAQLSEPHRKDLDYCVPEKASLWVLVDDEPSSLPPSWLLPGPASLPSSNTVSTKAEPADPADLFSSGIEYLMVPTTEAGSDGGITGFRQRLQKECLQVADLPQYGEIYFLGTVQLSRPVESRRVVAILAAYNEARFIDSCLENLISQNVDVYLLDNGSTDETADIAKKWLGKGLINIEYLPRNGTFQLKAQLKRKQELTKELEADWFLHVDADEILEPPPGDMNLAQAITAVEEAGYNMINFQEYTFVPTDEFPDHDHSNYQRTMRHYYPFAKHFPYGIRAWKNGPHPVDLTARGGHRPTFSDMRLCPVSFINKHYQFLSIRSALSKYGETAYDPEELDTGWHGGHGGWRDQFAQGDFSLPHAGDLRILSSGQNLDASHPWKTHYLEQLAGASNWNADATVDGPSS